MKIRKSDLKELRLWRKRARKLQHKSSELYEALWKTDLGKEYMEVNDKYYRTTERVKRIEDRFAERGIKVPYYEEE